MTRPKERGILFSAAMVRAILDGRKTVTRRIVTVPWRRSVRALPYDPYWVDGKEDGLLVMDDYGDYHPAESALRGYGRPGDRLWVRETWRPCIADGGGHIPDAADVVVRYAADESTLYYPESRIPDEWTMPKAAARGMVTPLHMPRWASRLVLEIVDVRIERLQAISEEDAAREGVDPVTPPGAAVILDRPSAKSHRYAFAMLWLDLHGENAPWDTNPWVWRLEFKTHFSRRGTA